MRRMMIVSIAINILLIICTFDDFLSLHDIKADYVSKAALDHLELKTSAPLPIWTDTRLEWASVSVSYVVRLVLLVSNAAVLCTLVRRIERGDGVP